MKYIIDVDALKDCINLLPIPYRINGVNMVCLSEVQEMIDKFPKDKYKEDWETELEAMKKSSSDIEAIRKGEGLKALSTDVSKSILPSGIRQHP